MVWGRRTTPELGNRDSPQKGQGWPGASACPSFGDTPRLSVWELEIGELYTCEPVFSPGQGQGKEKDFWKRERVLPPFTLESMPMLNSFGSTFLFSKEKIGKELRHFFFFLPKIRKDS